MTFLEGDGLTDPSAAATTEDADIAQRHADANAALRELRDAATIVVEHGATAGTDRPGGVGHVRWVGSVEPTNATTADEWWDTANNLLKSKASGSFVASGTGTYRSDDTPIWTPATSFVATNGSPTLSFSNGDVRPPAYLLDGGSDERLSATEQLPESWDTCNIVAVIEDTAGTGGDVRLEVRYRWVDDGGDTAVPAFTSAVTATVAAANLTKHVTLASGVTVSPGLLMARVVRYGADGADTHTGDIAFLGLRIEKAS